jgi:hypothetical protein
MSPEGDPDGDEAPVAEALRLVPDVFEGVGAVVGAGLPLALPDGPGRSVGSLGGFAPCVVGPPAVTGRARGGS